VTFPNPSGSAHSIVQFFVQGGLFMIPLVLCSIVSGAVIVVRGLALRRAVVMPPEIEREIEAIQPASDPEAFARLSRVVRSDYSTLARLAEAVLQHLQWPKAENNEAVQTRARHEIVRLESGLFILEIIVGIAPLLGLLGAVSGLVGVFAAFGADAATQDPHGIAKGISEALSTTIVGLAIAIPSLIAYSYFSKKIETMAAEMESLVSDLLVKCYHQKEQRRPAPRTTAKQGTYSGPPALEEEVL
jgi:biopolymer transport protein ExbB